VIGLGGLVGTGGLLLYWTGSHYIDWWELAVGYWWVGDDFISLNFVERLVCLAISREHKNEKDEEGKGKEWWTARELD